MKILIIPNNDTDGCYKVRNLIPYNAIKKVGHEVRMTNKIEFYFLNGKNRMDTSNFDWADVIIFNRHYDNRDELISSIINYCKNKNKTVLYDTDDLLMKIEKNNPAYSTISKRKKHIETMLNIVDGCTTTTPELKLELQKYNNNVEVLPNCVLPDEWVERKRNHKKLRIGWAGSSTHAKDLLIIIDVIKDLKKIEDFEFIIFGFSSEPLKDYFNNLKEKHKKEIKKLNNPNAKPAEWYLSVLELEKALKGLEYIHYPFVKIEEYNKMLSDIDLDIGLCPLVDNPFNRCKSAIKFYEYAMVGTVTLASKIPPYESEVNYCAKNRFNKWKSKLLTLIQNKDKRKEILAEQQKWVKENRNIDKNINNWLDYYKKICQKVTQQNQK